MAFYYLKVSQVKRFCYLLASEVFRPKKYPPMPAFKYHNENALLAPLSLVRFRYYKTIFEKAAYLGYAITTGHPFRDGNKRMGMMITLTFLLVNGYSLDVKRGKILEIALKIAQKKMSQEKFCKWLERNSKKAPKKDVNGLKRMIKSIK